MRRGRPVALIAVGFALLLCAWVFASPPFRGPDEGAQYVRAVDIATGKLLGPRVPYAGATPAQSAWIQHDNIGVFVSPQLAPPTLPCVDSVKMDTAQPGCQLPTYTGDYQPLPYLLPAAGIAVSHGVGTALWLARLGQAIACICFLALAFALLWDGVVWSVLGLFLAITPMTLFIGSVINASGLTIAANLAVIAALIRVCRRAEPIRRWVWTALAVSGAVTILSYQLGWAYVLLDFTLPLLLLDLGSLRALVHRHVRAVFAIACVVCASGAVFLGYASWSGLLHGGFDVHPLGSSLYGGLQQAVSILPSSVGSFGPLVVPLPRASVVIWWVLVLSLAAGALVVSDRRGRVSVVIVMLIAAAFPVFFFAWALRLSGFGLQARYAMPVFALVPMLGGELIYRRRGALSARFAFAAGCVLVLVAGLQLFAWWFNAHASAGRASYWFLTNPRWSPPLGWIPWTTAAVLGGCALAAVGLREAFASYARAKGELLSGEVIAEHALAQPPTL